MLTFLCYGFVKVLCVCLCKFNFNCEVVEITCLELRTRWFSSCTKLGLVVSLLTTVHQVLNNIGIVRWCLLVSYWIITVCFLQISISNISVSVPLYMYSLVNLMLIVCLCESFAQYFFLFADCLMYKCAPKVYIYDLNSVILTSIALKIFILSITIPILLCTHNNNNAPV